MNEMSLSKLKSILGSSNMKETGSKFMEGALKIKVKSSKSAYIHILHTCKVVWCNAYCFIISISSASRWTLKLISEGDPHSFIIYSIRVFEVPHAHAIEGIPFPNVQSILQSQQLSQHLFDRVERANKFSKGRCSWLTALEQKMVFNTFDQRENKVLLNIWTSSWLSLVQSLGTTWCTPPPSWSQKRKVF